MQACSALTGDTMKCRAQFVSLKSLSDMRGIGMEDTGQYS